MFLQITDPAGTVRHIDLGTSEGEWLLGRSDSCDVCLPESSVSRKHAKVFGGPETFFITDLGSGTNRISVAIYDKKKDRYVLGVQVDKILYSEDETPLERDVYACRFLEQKGWNIMRVWSRDWWHNAHDVIERIRHRADSVLTPAPAPRRAPKHGHFSRRGNTD